MTAIQRFIEDAIAGGWLYLSEHTPYIPEDLKAPGVAQFTIEDGINFLITIEQALLDPLAWQAVGKTRGWNNVHENSKECYHFDCPCHDSGFPWRENWHRFIDNLADGKSIEEALSELD